jgi:hypothetical protein
MFAQNVGYIRHIQEINALNKFSTNLLFPIQTLIEIQLQI